MGASLPTQPEPLRMLDRKDEPLSPPRAPVCGSRRGTVKRERINLPPALKNNPISPG